MLHIHSHGLDQYWRLLFTLSLKLQDHEGWMVVEVAWLARATETLRGISTVLFTNWNETYFNILIQVLLYKQATVV